MGFSQNILFLKNGDKLKGKLEGYKNDTITFRLEENLLKFKTSNISCIYFDDILSPKDIINVTNANETKPVQESRILGVVTYRYNFDIGFLPDIGAQVYISDSTKLLDFNHAVVDSSENANGGFAGMYRKKYNLNKEAVKELDGRAKINIKKLKYSPNTITAVVDGTGSYLIKVKPGTYYILIESTKRDLKKLYSFEIFLTKRIIKEGEEINLSWKF